MRTIGFSLAFLLTAAAAVAQRPARGPQPDKTYTSAADVEALIAKAKSGRKEGQALVGGRLLHLAPYNVNLEYRASVGPAAIHENQAEIFYVLDGSATLITGGKLVNEKRTNPTNLSGTGIEGGMSRTVSKGDFIVVPENTPHWFSKIDGTIILATLHVPRPVPAAAP